MSKSLSSELITPATHSTGVIPSARGVIDIAAAAFKRYSDGEISAHQIEGVMYRVRTQLGRACWCDEDVCCQIHQTHVSPHQHCVLR